jgi:hypothetical protein
MQQADGLPVTSFREMPYTKKILMVLAIFFLMLMELKSLKQDKVDHDAQSKKSASPRQLNQAPLEQDQHHPGQR